MEESPVQFITIDEEGKFVISKEAREILEKETNDLVVIGIVGKYRSGKSYLLNRLFKQQKGFALGSTVKGCTRGIWMWGKPAQGHTSTLLLDTEGLFDTENRDQNYDIKLFALSILLTSYLLLNTQNTIDESTIRDLSLVTELTEHIRVKSKNKSDKEEEEETGEDFDRYFPDLLWVVRDFSLDLNVSGKNVTDEEYLQNALNLRKGTSKPIREANDRRSCVTLVRPVNDEKDLQNLENIPYEKLRPEFIEKMDALTTRIFKEAKVKQLLSDEDNSIININGKRFLMLAENYVNAFNNGAIPDIGGAWETLCKASNTEALNKALQHYEESMNEHVKEFPMDISELSQLHQQYFEACLDVFHKDSIGPQQKEFQDKLSEQIAKYENNVLCDGILFKLDQKNKTASKEFCEGLLKKLFDVICSACDQKQLASYKEYEEKVHAMLKEYNEQSKGPEAASVLHKFMEQLKLHQQAQMVHFKLEKAEQDNAEQKQKLREQQIEMARVQEETRKKMKDLETAQKQHERELQDVIAKKEAELAEAKRKAEEDIEARKKELELALQQNRKDMAEMYKEQITALTQSFSTQQQMFQKQMELLYSEIKSLREEQSKRQSQPVMQFPPEAEYQPRVSRGGRSSGATICGAPTKKGGPCQRNVKYPPCYQHK